MRDKFLHLFHFTEVETGGKWFNRAARKYWNQKSHSGSQVPKSVILKLCYIFYECRLLRDKMGPPSKKNVTLSTKTK